MQTVSSLSAASKRMIDGTLLESEIADFVAYADVKLQPGDVVVLYTDGITEADDINGVKLDFFTPSPPSSSKENSVIPSKKSSKEKPITRATIHTLIISSNCPVVPSQN